MRYGILLGDFKDAQDKPYVDLNIVPRRDAEGKVTRGLIVGESDPQNIQLIMLAQQGELKEYPQLGFGITNLINGEYTSMDSTRLQIQLKIDGYTQKDVEVLINGETI